MRFAWEVLTETGPLKGAELCVEQVPVRLGYRGCGLEFAPEEQMVFAACPTCGAELGHRVPADRGVQMDNIGGDDERRNHSPRAGRTRRRGTARLNQLQHFLPRARLPRTPVRFPPPASSVPACLASDPAPMPFPSSSEGPDSGVCSNPATSLALRGYGGNHSPRTAWSPTPCRRRKLKNILQNQHKT